MGWSDSDWDDWVRGQPGTFWGEQKRALQNRPQNISTPPVAAPRGTSPRGTPSQSGGVRREASFEELLHGLILFGAGGWAGYSTYQAEQEIWVIVAAFFGAMIPVHLILSSALGRMFIRMLRFVITLCLLGGLAYFAVKAWRDLN